MQKYLTPKQLTNYLQIGMRTLFKLLKDKQIPAIKLRGAWRFDKDKIDRWMNKKSQDNI